MVWPTVAVDTTGMDADTDSLPRAAVLDLTTKFNEAIAARAQASGVCDLDASALVPIARIPAGIARTADAAFTGTFTIADGALAGAKLNTAALNDFPTIAAASGDLLTFIDVSDANKQKKNTGSSVIGAMLSVAMDAAFGSTRGSIVLRGASGWVNLSPGTSGYYLQSNGAGADPAYTAVSTTPPAASVGQSQLKTTSGSVSVTATAGISTLPGGAYGFYPRVQGVQSGDSGDTWGSQILSYNADTDFGPSSLVYLNANLGTLYAYQQYVTASPPYNLGNGDIPLFVFAVVDNVTKKILSTYVAPDPCWAYNGPTDIRPDYIDPVTGKKYKVRKDESTLPANLKNKKSKDLGKADRDEYLDLRKSLPTVLVEIDQALKQSDMPLIPHPFIANDLTGKTVIMLEPVGNMIERLAMMHDDGESVAEVLHGDYLQIDNLPLIGVSAPPGVGAHKVAWK